MPRCHHRPVDAIKCRHSGGSCSRCRFITNIINGGIECVKGSNAQVENRIGFYKRFCDANRLWQPKPSA
ncbi:Endochitinase 2 [Vitis vinifera]|uniref:Endochitinase 2 n=1 Tax=Vitis vinifera TaxID=29760 RepID=A0A438K5F2_VITVI|nr:Endochitinase 2 [Vitis vinifera]